jgi:hypothetical protein
MELKRTPKTGQHVTKVVYLDGVRSKIDINIAPLIEGLFKLGIKTFSSCGAGCGGWCGCSRTHKLLKKVKHKNKYTGKEEVLSFYRTPKRCAQSVWLVFETMEDASNFLNVAYREDDPQDIQDYMLGQGGSNSNAWHWSCNTTDLNDHRVSDSRGYWVGKRVGPAVFGFNAHLTFPHAHLELVTRRVLDELRT